MKPRREQDANHSILDTILTEIRDLRAQVDQLLGRDEYTVAEIAKITGWSAEHIRDRCNDGRTNAKRIDGVRDAWVIPASELAKIPRKVK